ncbi:glycerol ethanol, ferric requiring protein, partial [Massospora cicadina]
MGSPKRCRFADTLSSNWHHPPQDNFDRFSTVDWVADINQSRVQAYKSRETRLEGRLDRRVMGVYEAAQSWLVVLLVGVAVGSLAAAIDITSTWLSDLKFGVCRSDWYLNRKFCCWVEAEDQRGSQPPPSHLKVGACTNWISWSLLLSSRESPTLAFIFYVSFGTLFALLSAFLVRRFAPTAAGSGIPQIKTILGGFAFPHFLGESTLMIKTIALVLAVSSGLSLGKEGPSVHLACCIGAVISKWFSKFRDSQVKNREILSAAAAAGVAVAFGSPTGGVLYSLEELSTLFPKKTLWRSFFGCLVATVVLHSWNPFRTGKIVLFQVPGKHNWHAFEILVFVLIGIFGGVYGVLTIRLNLWATAFRQNHLKHAAIAEISLLAAITSAICFFSPFLSVDMSESMYVLFRECDQHFSLGLCKAGADSTVVVALLWAALIRFALVVVTYGCDVPTGIFIPSMAIGACFGRAVGIFIKAIHVNTPHYWMFASCPSGGQCVFPGTYAILGAASALCGITRMTGSGYVIMFELTGATEFILPLMVRRGLRSKLAKKITVIVAKAIGDPCLPLASLTRRTADQAIKWKGFPFMENETPHISAVPVAQAMSKRPTCLPAAGVKLGQLESILRGTRYKGFPVIKRARDHRLEGYISRESIAKVLAQAYRRGAVSPSTLCFFSSVPSGPAASSTIDFGPLVDQNPFVVHPKLPLATVQSIFRKIGPRALLVELHGHLVGLITKKDVLNYERQMERDCAIARSPVASPRGQAPGAMLPLSPRIQSIYEAKLEGESCEHRISDFKWKAKTRLDAALPESGPWIIGSPKKGTGVPSRLAYLPRHNTFWGS